MLVALCGFSRIDNMGYRPRKPVITGEDTFNTIAQDELLAKRNKPIFLYMQNARNQKEKETLCIPREQSMYENFLCCVTNRIQK